MAIRMIKLATRVSLAAALLSGAAFLYRPGVLLASYLMDDPVAEAEIALGAVPDDSFTSLFDRAISEGDAELAASVMALAEERGVELSADAASRVDAASAFDITRAASEMWSGLTSGDAKTPTSFAASLVADMSAVGDLRDLYGELSSYPDYDALTVGLAATGLAATGATVASGLNALPAKVGVSLLKSAKRAGKISPSLRDDLSSIVSSSFRPDEARAAMASLSGLDAGAATASASRILDGRGLERLAGSASDLGRIASDRGYRATLDTLSLAGNTTDLNRLGKVSGHYGDRYRAVLGLTARGGRLGIDALALLASMAWWLAGAVAWTVGAFLLLRDTVRGTMALVAGRKAALRP